MGTMVMTDNGDEGSRVQRTPRSIEESLELIFEELARVKTSIDGIKSEMRTLAPRLDNIAVDNSRLTTRIETLIAEFREVQSKLHRSNNLLTLFSDELQEVHQARLLFERSVDVLEARVKVLREEVAKYTRVESR